jgi:predicted lipoprotein with Yx(FWY)xxD motif
MATILVLMAAALSAVPASATGPYGSSGGGGSGAAASPAVSTSVQVGTTSTAALGTVLTGPNGMTLYTLSSDPNNGSVCTAKCLGFWPPLLVTSGGTVTGPSGTSLTFATFTRADDGTTQLAADGRALYYFANDTAAGQTNGEGIKGAGGVWHVASATAAATPATAAPASAAPAGGGYGSLPGSGATTSSSQVPASSDTTMPVWPLALVLALAVIVVATFGLRRMRRVNNR